MLERLRGLFTFRGVGLGGSPAPENLSEIYEDECLDELLTGLGESEMRVATLVAGSARPLTYVELSRMADIKASRVRKACRTLESKGLIALEGWRDVPFEERRRTVAPTGLLYRVHGDLRGSGA